MRNWTDEYEMDAAGRLRKKGHARDGELASFMFLDGFNARGGTEDSAMKVDVDPFAGHRPGGGYAVRLNDDLRQEADKAYEDRKRRMSSAWKRKGTSAPQPQRGRRNAGGAFPVPRASPDGHDDDHPDEQGHG